MAKERTETKEIWIEKDGNKVSIGFTRDFLGLMAECWHILPATKKNVKEGVPLMMIETNSELISIPSPLTAYMSNFSDKARNFPDLLTEEDVIMKLNLSQEKEKEVKNKAALGAIDLWAANIPPQVEVRVQGGDWLVQQPRNINNIDPDF